jgi:hypothetical protein
MTQQLNLEELKSITSLVETLQAVCAVHGDGIVINVGTITDSNGETLGRIEYEGAGEYQFHPGA